MTAIIYFKDQTRGYASFPVTKVFIDDAGADQMVFAYQDDILCGVFRLDIIDSVYVTGALK